MALLNVRWKSSDRHGGERRESMVMVTLRPAKANATVTFGFLAELFCHALSNSAVSISLLSSAMNSCIKPLSPKADVLLYGVPVFSVPLIDLACHSCGGRKLRYQDRHQPRGQGRFPAAATVSRGSLCGDGPRRWHHPAKKLLAYKVLP